MSQVFVSVVIPVLNDAQRLAVCLGALRAQTYPKDLFEVIVVDNGSTDDIKSVIDEFKDFTFVLETGRGPAAARNKGVTLARGEIIAFTDADCVPAPDWIEKAVKSMSNVPKCDVIAGKVELFFKDANNPKIVELYESIWAFQQERCVEKSRFGVTANLITYKQVFKDVGLFDSNTFKTAAGEDREWGNRVFSSGRRIVYADDVRVAHPAVSSWKELFNKEIRIARGNFLFAGEKTLPTREYFSITVKRASEVLESIVRFWSDKRVKGKRQKIAVIFVQICMRFVGFFERTRLRLSGKDNEENKRHNPDI